MGEPHPLAAPRGAAGVEQQRVVAFGNRRGFERRAGFEQRTLCVKGLSAVRGPAPQAALLYEETAASLLARANAAEQRRIAPEPSQGLSQGRPTKRDRRQLQDLRTPDWNERWSASIDH